MNYDEQALSQFWWFSQERYRIHLRREAGVSWPWTEDPHLRDKYFCNVFRSDDRTSKAIASLVGVMDPYEAAVVGRLTNRLDTLDLIARGIPVSEAVAQCGLNTNAYRLNTPLGLNSAQGVLLLMAQAVDPLVKNSVLNQGNTKDALQTLGQVSYLGGFVGYQIILDLIEFRAFNSFWFADNWAYPGVGAQRGALTLLGRREESLFSSLDKSWKGRRRGDQKHMVEVANQVIPDLLHQSRDPTLWPWVDRPWSIHEAEGQLCEYDKYYRCLEGSMGGRRFKPRS